MTFTVHHQLNEQQLRVQKMALICFGCGLRLGRHRVGDNRCPNPLWKPGNGNPQWRENWVFRNAR